MKNTVKVFGIIALMAVIAFSTAACSKKASGGESSSGSSGNSSSGSVKSAGKEAPATDFKYDLTEDKKGIVITKYMGKGGKVVIPAKIEDYPVVEIGEKAFLGQTDSGYNNANEITEVVIPEGVVRIGNSAFRWIDNLKSVTFPASLENIASDWAFAQCENLETLTIPNSLTKIYFGTDLGYVEILGENVAFDAVNVFWGCGKLPLKTRSRLQELGYKGSF